MAASCRRILTATRGLFFCALLLGVMAPPIWGRVKVEKVAYFNQPNCYKLSNGTVEVIVTTDIGPRVIRYSFAGGENILAELPDTAPHDSNKWKPWGGHRLWTAPEEMPRSYSPDNSPIQYQIEGDAIRLTQPVEPQTGIQKEIHVTLDAEGTGVTILHRITNRNLWAIDVAPWALTIMNGGGVTILPQEPFRAHGVGSFLPERPLALWAYTDLSDPRWTIGKKFIRLRTDARMEQAQKIGIANKQGWAAYYRHGTLFIKRFAYQEGATYPDYGCNTETFTSGSFMEVETLAPMHRLEPGQSAEHTERWYLFRDVSLGADEDSIERAIKPLLAQTTLK